MGRSWRLVVFGLCAGMVGSAVFGQDAASSSYAGSPEFQAALTAAQDSGTSPTERLARWKKASELANGQCIECLRGMIAVSFKLGEWKETADDAIALDAVATSKKDRLYAEESAGRGLIHGETGQPSREQLVKAETYFHAAVTLEPRALPALLDDARVLATLGRDEDAKAAFAAYVAQCTPTDLYRDFAQKAAADPAAGVMTWTKYDNSWSPIPPGGVGPAVLKARAAASAPAAAPTQEGPSQASASAPAYESDPKFQKALADAKQGRQTDEDRLDNWKHANKVAKGQCIECFREVIRLQRQTGAVKDAVSSAQQLEAIATDPNDKLYAEAQRGECLMAFNSGQPKPDQVKQAEAAFHDVLAAKPKSRVVLFDEGRALAMLGRMDEAKAMFERYVDIAPASDKLRGRAERFSDDPHLATLQMAPPFRLVTSEGEEMNLDDMQGKVVLLDFWATWCGPCKETLPEVQHIAKQYANDPMLVVISVSTDQDASLWRAFIQKNNMTWPQYRDKNSALSNAYGVSSIPRFFSIDTNGVLKSEQLGSGADVGGMVSDLVKKAHKAADKKAKETDKASSGN